MNNQQLNTSAKCGLTSAAYPSRYIDLMVQAENCHSRKEAIEIIHTATKVLIDEYNTYRTMD
jgi:hypothetical protein